MKRIWLSCVLCVGCNAFKKAAGVDVNTALNADTHMAFPVAHDAKHAGVDCNACHGGFDSFTQFSCTSGCHAQAACDAGHPGMDDYRYDSPSCLACHPGGTADGSFAAHPFPIDAAAVHANIKCASCHTVSGDYARFSCTSGCHAQPETDPVHGGIQGYAYDSPSCLQCHPKGIADATTSHTQFPIGAGTSHAVGCTQCHTSATKRGDVTTLACAACHAQRGVNAKHAQVADYAASSDKCVACHADDQVDAVAAHHQFPIAFGKVTHDTRCLDCHNAHRSDKPWGADFHTSDCLTCHAQHPNVTQAALAPGHAGVTDYQYTSAACLSCHPTGTGIAPADHDTHFPISTSAKHAGIGCTECHTDLTQTTNAANYRCATCHVSLDAALLSHHTTATPSGLRTSAREISATDSRTCLRCHEASKSYSRHSTTTTLCNGDAGTPPHKGAGCTDCHSAYKSAPAYAADFDGATPPGCKQCHENGQLCP